MDQALRQFATKVAYWRSDAIAFVRDVMGVEPDAWQKDVLRAWVSENPVDDRLTLQACTGPGKSAVEAFCGWHFLTCQGEEGNHPNAFAVSITSDNLRDGLWKELAHWRNRSPLLQQLFEWQKEQIFHRHHPETWWLRARTFSKSADQEAQGRTLSGLHSKYIAYFIDESGDMPPSVGRSAEQGLSTGPVFGKIIQAGNPTSLTGLLYTSANSGVWNVFRISGDPDDPMAWVHSPRVGPGPAQWAREQIQLHGRSDPWVMAYILGQFPPASFNALLGPDEVRDAMNRGLKAQDYEFSQKRLGVDVARFGDDQTVLFPRQGLRAFRPVGMRGARTDEIAARIMKAKKDWSSELEMIDNAGGWAAGVIDSCRLAGVELYPVNPSGNAFDARYFNMRSEMKFMAAAWVKNGGGLPNMPELIPEMTAETYTFVKGKFKVIEKDQVKVLLNGRSPDYWDALCQTFALPDMPAETIVPAGWERAGEHLLHEYDPFAMSS